LRRMTEHYGQAKVGNDVSFSVEKEGSDGKGIFFTRDCYEIGAKACIHGECIWLRQQQQCQQ
jgi:hypothetical protein